MYNTVVVIVVFLSTDRTETEKIHKLNHYFILLLTELHYLYHTLDYTQELQVQEMVKLTAAY